jgi:hypothetical protein
MGEEGELMVEGRNSNDVRVHDSRELYLYLVSFLFYVVSGFSYLLLYTCLLLKYYWRLSFCSCLLYSWVYLLLL